MRVLVVDDDPTLLKMLREMFARSGIEVFTSSSGAEGVAATRELAPDVVVLDLMMPEINGWEACKKIREFSTVPILVLSAVTDSPKVMQCLDAGADDYLVKPVPTGVLVGHVKRLAQKKR